MAREAGKAPLFRSASAYDRTLRAFGGCRVQATTIGRDDGLYVVMYESPPYDLKVAPVDTPRLSINLMDSPVCGALQGDRPASYDGRRHSLFLTPAGAGAHWIKTRPSRHLNIYFSDSVVEELADGSGAGIGRDRPLLGIDLRHQRAWVDALERAICCDLAPAEDAALSLASLILADLARAPGRPMPTLGHAEVERVRAYIAANLSRSIRVSELAAIAGLSVARFSVCFRQATGIPPYRFLLGQRVAAALQMLRCDRYSTAQVAIACGFSSQQHLTTAMRQHTGLTPGRARS